ncbi:hypothetical protein GCM10010842_00260 [Deinococcus daejeonensis]|uniref:Uncharacterized protein n=1 Tax=Deinococcus daejeonensis TaxID=1007098 RepID=A0ABQ2ITW7_9DEIO|nr:hypothetical protein GCM10010842_00260 [Deinococcus daejeonensis]
MLGAGGVGFPRRGGKARAGAVAFQTRAEILQGVSRPADSAWGLPGGEGWRRVCRLCLGALSGMAGAAVRYAWGVFARMGGNLERAGFITIPSRGAVW